MTASSKVRAAKAAKPAVEAKAAKPTAKAKSTRRAPTRAGAANTWD
jgi:hypothetical protein